jgi:hypothetical protein
MAKRKGVNFENDNLMRISTNFMDFLKMLNPPFHTRNSDEGSNYKILPKIPPTKSFQKFCVPTLFPWLISHHATVFFSSWNKSVSVSSQKNRLELHCWEGT